MIPPDSEYVREVVPRRLDPVLPFQQTLEGCVLAGVEQQRIVLAGVPLGMQVSRSRAAPWLRNVRIPRFGRGVAPSRAAELIPELARWVGQRPVRRLHLEIWTENPEERSALSEACRAEGFRRAETPRSYERTIWMDLSVPEDDLMAGFHPTARRHIRAPGKKGCEVRPVVQAEAAPRLEEIFRETFLRTGGDRPALPWGQLIHMSNRPGARLRVLGLFGDGTGSDRPLLGFVIGFLHGEVAEYAHAGSVRDPAYRLPILYAPTWELMRWARGRDARWWDFGGMPAGPSSADDPRAGIATFKSYFSADERVVGEEWVLELPKLSSVLARIGRGMEDGAP